jgi:transposase
MSARKLESTETSQAVNKICAGIDVHRDFVSVTLISENEDGKIQTDYKSFTTVKKDLLALRDGLLSKGCTTVGIESTGKYWYAVHNALEGAIDVHVFNARNMKNIPGKKTDRADSQWIAKITRHALLMPSFIPKRQIRDSRIFSRTRKSLVQQRTCIRQQIHGILDSASIKLSSVVSDIFGTSGMNLIKLLMSGKPITEAIIKKLVHGPLCNKTEALLNALDGYFRYAHLLLLQTLLDEEKGLTDKIRNIEAKLKTFLLDSPEKIDIFERIIKIPGFTERSALLLLSEIGFDLSSFPSSKNFCSWAGLAPGKHESAGINKSGKIEVRQRYLKSLLIEVALAAVKCNNTYYKAKYHSMKYRTGSSKAIVAIAHKLAKAIYEIIKEDRDYIELTNEYLTTYMYQKDMSKLSKLAEKMGKDFIITHLSKQEGDEN